MNYRSCDLLSLHLRNEGILLHRFHVLVLLWIHRCWSSLDTQGMKGNDWSLRGNSQKFLKTIFNLRLVLSPLPSFPLFFMLSVHFLFSIILIWKYSFYITVLRKDDGILFCIFACLFLRQFHYVALAGVVLTMFLPQPPEHPPQWHSTLYLRQGLSLSLGLTDLVELAAQWASGIPLLLQGASVLGLHTCTNTPQFLQVLRILKLARQAHWQLIHLPRLILELDWTEQKTGKNSYINILLSCVPTQFHSNAVTRLTIFTWVFLRL